ncbi:MAG: DNA ligase [Candidatus Hydrogenedentes bacterium CG07_land_8_20_14_0_80_42_17]|nr:MAG: DNA ligase [Candidatus Hydrogenedentes bacterium CG07_land_8_20_14_0_80_42_17]
MKRRTHENIVSSAKLRMQELIDEILRHNWLYYVTARPEISDHEYDFMLKELMELEKKFPELARQDSPTNKVGATEKKSNQIKHEIPLLSLDNTYSPEELMAFDNRVRSAVGNKNFKYVVEPKIDGVAVALLYLDGQFKFAATRGDGFAGEDVSSNVTTIKELPLKIKRIKGVTDGALHLRGEVYISRERFAKLSEQMTEEGSVPFANPRNTAAGTLKLMAREEVKRRELKIFIHSFAGRDSDYFKFMMKLEKLGMPVVPNRILYDSAEKILTNLKRKEEEKRSYLFDTDGLVIKVDSYRLRRELGEKARSPRWAIAYKFSPETAESKLLAIELQVGRTGVITPVAKFEPVHLSGTTVSSATLHNEDEIKRLDIRVGDYVVVQKAGEIIPQIISVKPAEKRNPPFVMPNKCPVCFSLLEKEEGKIKWKCTGVNCIAAVRAKILHFGSRKAMEIDGLGESMVDELVSSGLVKNISDLYFLSADQLISLPRMAEKSAKNLLKAIAASKEKSLERFIFALGISGIGETTARDLANEFGSLKALREASIEDLIQVSEIGEILAKSVYDFMREPAAVDLLDKLHSCGLKACIEEKKREDVNGPLLGKKVVVTGSIPGLSRTEAEEAVRKMGGSIQSSVSGKTNLLVLGNEPGSKYSDALKRGIEIMEYGRFLELWNSHSNR